MSDERAFNPEQRPLSRVPLALYSAALALVAVASAPWWLFQMAHSGKYREGLLERLGQLPARLTPPGTRAIWVHAVSVGEVLAASRLVEGLGDALPDFVVYVSTTTRTGQALARERFGQSRVFYFPLDFAFAMRAWLRFLRPSLVVLIESEFWPRMLFECQRAAIPVAVVNARISDRSWPRYRRLRRLWSPLLHTLSMVLAQSERDAERLRWLGAHPVVAGGNLKYDVRRGAEASFGAAPLTEAPFTEAPFTGVLRRALPPGVQVVVCGSTLGGEEALLLRALPIEEIVTVLAPRHPERFDEVARAVLAAGARLLRRSAWSPGAALHPDPGTPGPEWPLTCTPDTGKPNSVKPNPGKPNAGTPAPVKTGLGTPGPGKSGPGTPAPVKPGLGTPGSSTLGPGTVLLLDSIGELASVYSLATVAVVGGGFLHPGGHNPLEPAQHAVPVVMGTGHSNFQAIVQALLAENAVVLADPASLAAALRRVLADERGSGELGLRGQTVVAQHAGASARALAVLLTLVKDSQESLGATIESLESESLQSIESVQSIESLQSIKSVQSIESLQSVESVQSMQPGESVQSVSPMQSMPSTSPGSAAKQDRQDKQDRHRAPSAVGHSQ